MIVAMRIETKSLPQIIPLASSKTSQNLPKALAEALLFDTRRTLNRTVFDSGRH